MNKQGKCKVRTVWQEGQDGGRLWCSLDVRIFCGPELQLVGSLPLTGIFI